MLTQSQVVQVQIDAQGTSALYPNTEFSVDVSYVNEAGTLDTTTPWKYPTENFTPQYNVTAIPRGRRLEEADEGEEDGGAGAGAGAPRDETFNSGLFGTQVTMNKQDLLRLVSKLQLYNFDSDERYKYFYKSKVVKNLLVNLEAVDKDGTRMVQVRFIKI